MLWVDESTEQVYRYAVLICSPDMPRKCQGKYPTSSSTSNSVFCSDIDRFKSELEQFCSLPGQKYSGPLPPRPLPTTPHNCVEACVAFHPQLFQRPFTSASSSLSKIPSLGLNFLTHAISHPTTKICSDTLLRVQNNPHMPWIRESIRDAGRLFPVSIAAAASLNVTEAFHLVVAV